MGLTRVSQKHCFETVEETSNHSLAEKYNSLLRGEASQAGSHFKEGGEGTRLSGDVGRNT